MLGRKKSEEVDTKWFPGKFLGMKKKGGESCATDHSKEGALQETTHKEETENDGIWGDIYTRI